MTPEVESSPFLTEEREHELSELAEFIANEHFPGSGAVDPECILRSAGLTLSYGNYEDAFDGLLEHRDGRFHVYCNVARCRTSTRRRFTLGHELGHYYIDEHREALRAGRVPSHASFPLDSSNPVEREADCFAAALLAPEQRVRHAVGKQEHGIEAALHVARRLEVSPLVAAGRLLSFNQGLFATVFWAPDGYRWKRLSDDARRARMLKTIEQLDQLPADGPTARALRGESDECGFNRAGTTSASWFPYCKSADLLIEEAVALGEYGVLTLLRQCSA